VGLDEDEAEITEFKMWDELRLSASGGRPNVETKPVASPTSGE
jgi:hypothetical protein